MVFDAWFMVDAQPFKQALLNIIKRWSFMFKEHLINHVTNSLSDLHEFIKVTSSGLSVEVQEGDYDGLVEVMVHLLAVRDRQPNTGEREWSGLLSLFYCSLASSLSLLPHSFYLSKMECLNLSSRL